MPYSLDHQLFVFFNTLPHTPGTNAFALALSGIGNAGFVWIVIALLLFFREESRGWHFFAPFVAASGLAALASEFLLKPMIGRFRPPVTLLSAVVVGADVPQTYSFPSTHATLAWALAAVIASEDSRLGRVAYLLAFLVSLSRIYLGMHFPLDVVAGGLLGWAIGRMCVLVLSGYPPKKKKAASTRR